MPSQPIQDLVTAVGELIQVFTTVTNRLKLSAGDEALVTNAIADVRAALTTLGGPQGPSTVTAEAAAGATEVDVDSTEGWGKGEAFTTGPGTATDPSPVESGFVDAANPRMSPTRLKLKPPGLAAVLKVGQTIN